MKTRHQRTLQKEISFTGVGLHSGKEVVVRFCPAPVHSGILFQRVDLPGKPTIPAAIEYVQQTERSTTIGVGNCMVQTIEHVLAAVHAYNIDNLCIQVSEAEPPTGDGSSKAFVEMIESAGIAEQTALTSVALLRKPIHVSHKEIHLVALPSDELRISYTLHYPKTPVILSQYFSLALNEESFKQEIAPCRTFALYEEIKALMDQGLIRGGSLENAVVIKDDVIFSKEGLRFPDEMVRHKILDLLGDLALVGFPFIAHIVAIRSGHRSNVALGRELMKEIASY